MKLTYPACFYPCEEKKGGFTVEVLPASCPIIYVQATTTAEYIRTDRRTMALYKYSVDGSSLSYAEHGKLIDLFGKLVTRFLKLSKRT